MLHVITVASPHKPNQTRLSPSTTIRFKSSLPSITMIIMNEKPVMQLKSILAENDVVCGRNAVAHSHQGNKLFRNIIDEMAPRYQSTKSRSEKKEITLEVINIIRLNGGRFIKAELDDDVSTQLFEEASPEFIYEKVSHALRARTTKLARVQKSARAKMDDETASVREEPAVEAGERFEEILQRQQRILKDLMAKKAAEDGKKLEEDGDSSYDIDSGSAAAPIAEFKEDDASSITSTDVDDFGEIFEFVMTPDLLRFASDGINGPVFDEPLPVGGKRVSLSRTLDPDVVSKLSKL